MIRIILLFENGGVFLCLQGRRIQGCSKSVEEMGFSLLYKYNWEKIEPVTWFVYPGGQQGPDLYDTTRYSFEENGNYTFRQPGEITMKFGAGPVEVIQHSSVQTGVFRLNQAERIIEIDQSVRSSVDFYNRWRSPSSSIPQEPDGEQIHTTKQKILRLSPDSLVLEYTIYPLSLNYPESSPAPLPKFSVTFHSAPK